jgi:hypothetical protein
VIQNLLVSDANYFFPECPPDEPPEDLAAGAAALAAGAGGRNTLLTGGAAALVRAAGSAPVPECPPAEAAFAAGVAPEPLAELVFAAAFSRSAANLSRSPTAFLSSNLESFTLVNLATRSLPMPSFTNLPWASL